MDLKTVDDEIMLSDGRVIKIPVKRSEENIKEKEKGKIKVEKIPNVWGSSAGAGSDYFDLYRKQRNQENERMELMEKKWKEYTENQIFQCKRKEKIQYIEKKRLKKKNKRLIKKNKIKELRNSKKVNKIETMTKDLSTQLNTGIGKELTDQMANGDADIVTKSGTETVPKNCHSVLQSDEGNLRMSEQDEAEIEEMEELHAPPVDTNNFLVVKEDELF
ncbi:conserved protein, unknown function [Plasmodium ovale]|uniref:Uncharacterized protein n=2 Tax=Plasmodium ovale TaxID=36330 RepID=A0A1A8VPI5_PLAOA|nr:conserved protein, unknown function [Plasmodium ovale curtisi]SBS82800.1 conserved protein, unknown function [Plasmodium ovale curtisi]SBT86129.1 conserved protein, unknown function [Plasmodium ovale]